MPPHRLVLLRHAKAEQLGEQGAGTDHGRALTSRGRRDAAVVGEWLREHGLVPDLAVCSTARRTRETAAALGLAQPVDHHDALYDADVAGVLALVARTPATVQTLLVVGHEPTTSAVAAHLAGPGSDASALAVVRVGLPTAGLAVLDLRDWQATTAVLTQAASVRG